MSSPIKNWLSRYKKKVIRRLTLITARQLKQALDVVFVDPLPVLFVHSSLSSCGHVVGGPQTIVDVLRSRCGTLVLPCHSYCYPASGEVIAPIFDPRQTPSQIGAISDWFWQQPDVVRSVHPTHSVAALGPEATTICDGHETCDTPCGSATPYQTLINRNAAVLMFGCTLNTYTLFHTSEHLAACPYLYYPTQVELRYRDASDRVHSMKMWRQNMEFVRRFESMDQELEHAGLLSTVKLRAGRLLFIADSGAVHEYLMARLRDNPNYLLKDFGIRHAS